VPHTLAFRAGTGLIGGFSTMVANAAGPVAALYFMAVGLPKLAFIGTGAWTFFILNLFKVPFQVHLGLITAQSLAVSAAFAPAAMLGAAAGPFVVRASISAPSKSSYGPLSLSPGSTCSSISTWSADW
jgi:hypothetical protein